MASTVFQDYNQNTPIVSSWLNDVNALVYSTGKIPKSNLLIPVAWVRFVGATAIIQQSTNIVSVIRNSTGNYTINYQNLLTNVNNCYDISTSQAGFAFVQSETASSVTVDTTNTSNVASDPGFVSVVIYGAN